VQITAVEIHEQKNTSTYGKLIKAVYASCGYVYIFCTSQSCRLEYNWLFVVLGVEVWGAMSEKFVGKAVDENGDGLGV